MKRVAFYMTHPTQYHTPWFRALAESRKIDIHVYYGSRPNAEEQGAGFGVQFEWDVPLLEGYPNTVLRNVGSGSITDFNGIDAPEIERVIAETDYDAWVINGWRTRGEWRAITACFRRRVPMFIRGDSVLLHQRPLATRIAKHFVYRRWIPRFACYLTVGRLNERYYEHYGADRRRFVPVRHFVDNDLFARVAEQGRSAAVALRKTWNVRDGALTLLFAGKFVDGKQPMDAIRAVEEASNAGANVHLVMVGDGPLRAESESYSSSRNLPVTFAGFLNQTAMPAAYAASDILVLPSRSETWGLVVNEAMASGIPAIVSDQVGCAPDLVIPGESGSVFPAKDHHALARLIVEYATDRKRVKAEGKNANVRIRSYSLDAAVANTIVAAESFAR
jgi:glycosyltransferase involved in cell wall biosynthesis